MANKNATKETELLEWKDTVVGNLDYILSNLPEGFENRDPFEKFQTLRIIFMKSSVCYMQGMFKKNVEAIYNPETEVSEILINTLGIRGKFLLEIAEAIDLNFFGSLNFDFLEKYKKRVLSPAPKWMEETVFEEIWVVYNAFLIIDGIEWRSEEHWKDPMGWSFRLEAIRYVRDIYKKELEKEINEVGGTERFIRLKSRLSIIEVLYKCIRQEAEARKKEKKSGINYEVFQAKLERYEKTSEEWQEAKKEEKRINRIKERHRDWEVKIGELSVSAPERLDLQILKEKEERFWRKIILEAKEFEERYGYFRSPSAPELEICIEKYLTKVREINSMEEFFKATQNNNYFLSRVFTILQAGVKCAEFRHDAAHADSMGF